jgi:hypothetical protein
MRDGEVVTVQAGDVIPEAETWPNRGPWERLGFIHFVEDEPVPATQADDGPVFIKKRKYARRSA